MKILITILLGILFTSAFAPFHQFWAGFLSFTGLLMVLDTVQKPKNVFWYGWLFGFAHHVTGLYWISYSMMVEADKFAWMIPFSASILPAYFAIFTGIAAWATYRLRLKIISKIIFFAGFWTLMEFARGNVFTGFPWNLTGYTFLSDEAVSQGGAYIGVYGLSLAAVLLFTAPYLAVNYIKSTLNIPLAYRIPMSLYYIMLPLIAFVMLHDWGQTYIDANKGNFVKTRVRIVQPNIPQSEKFDEMRVGEQLYKYYRLSLQESTIKDFVPDLIVWPEAATPLNLDQDKEFLAEVADVIPFSTYLILGSIRYEGWMINQRVFNSVQFINSEGVLQRMNYDKAHLVPFGEYVPLRNYLPGVDKIAKGIGDFNHGPGPRTLKLLNSPPFSPQICYEIIFPDRVTDRLSKEKPEWILNITNDAWFGDTSGPRQHLDAVRMRAIEEGIPVIRSANTGISAVIDGTGHILNEIALNQEGIIDTKLPAKLENETFFSRYGNIIPLGLCCGLILLSLLLKCISIVLSKLR